MLAQRSDDQNFYMVLESILNKKLQQAGAK